jgi:hypothetical protein
MRIKCDAFDLFDRIFFKKPVNGYMTEKRIKRIFFLKCLKNDSPEPGKRLFQRIKRNDSD